LLKEPIQAPVSREIFRQWVEDYHLAPMVVRQAEGSLGFHKYAILPEICLLFAGEPEHLYATMDPCGLYDRKKQEFRFVNRTMAACVEGLSEAELWDRVAQGPNLMQLVKGYGKHAVEQGGYQIDPVTMEYDGLRRKVFTGLNAMTGYAGVLAARNEEDALLDLRDLAFEMQWFWRDCVYSEYEKGGIKQEQQYREKFDNAVSLARETGQPPLFDGQKAGAVLKALDVHATEDLLGNGNYFTVWQCSRLAKRLQEEYPRVRTEFGRRFPADYSERFRKFGCQDLKHLDIGIVLGQDVLMFRDPVPEGAVPEGWYSYHLAGRNLMKADRLLTSLPEKNYIGTVLSPYRLLDAGQQELQPQDLVIGFWNVLSLTDFCESRHLPEPDMSGIFPDQRQVIQSTGITLGGM